jgi:hypothetical protein
LGINLSGVLLLAWWHARFLLLGLLDELLRQLEEVYCCLDEMPLERILLACFVCSTNLLNCYRALSAKVVGVAHSAAPGLISLASSPARARLSNSAIVSRLM